MGVPPHAYAGTYLHYIDAAVVAECGNLNGGQTSMGTIWPKGAESYINLKRLEF